MGAFAKSRSQLYCITLNVCTDLVILPGVSVSVDLYHVLVSRAEAGAEDGVGDVPVHVYGLETGDCGHEGEEGQPGLLTHLHISRSLLSGGSRLRGQTVSPCHCASRAASLGLTSHFAHTVSCPCRRRPCASVVERGVHRPSVSPQLGASGAGCRLVGTPGRWCRCGAHLPCLYLATTLPASGLGYRV